MPLRPFVDRPVGNVEHAQSLAARAAATLGLPQPVLLRAGMNALFCAGDVIIRVGRPSAPAALSIDLADRLRDKSNAAPEPAARDVIADHGLSATFWQPLVDVGQPIDWSAVGAIVRRVHQLASAELPDGYPV